LAADLRRTGHTIDPAQFRLLIELYARACTLGELAQRCAVSAPTISRSVTTLEERGWVRRAASPEDGRQVVAELTPLGHGLIEEMKRNAERRVARYLKPLSGEDLRKLLGGFEVLQRVFEAALAETE
jgi:DNA-binding MarR family transcriptional regulator